MSSLVVRRATQQRFDVYYDGKSAICVRSIGLLQSLHIAAHVSYFDSHKQQSKRRVMLMARSLPKFDQAMWVWDGRTLYEGFFAFRVLVEHTPRLRALATIMKLPFAPVIGQYVYRIIARNRDRIGCRCDAAAACDLG